MHGILMDGKHLSTLVKKYISEEIKEFKKKEIHPKLATVLVGDDPASKIYISIKHKACDQTGIESENYYLKHRVDQQTLLDLIETLNNNQGVHGILVQLPLPQQIDGYTVVSTIKPAKDVDGLNPYNMGRLSYKRHDITSCTPAGVMLLLTYYGIELAGKHVVIINRSPLVGKPLLLLNRFDPLQMHLFNADMLLLNNDAVVTICHSKTKNLLYFTQDADILISAVGQRPHFRITADMIKTGSTIIDIGVSRIDGKIMGDVEFDEVRQKAGYITPNPGGVGPLTVAMLLYNTIKAASNQTNIPIRRSLEDFLKNRKIH